MKTFARLCVFAVSALCLTGCFGIGEDSSSKGASSVGESSSQGPAQTQTTSHTTQTSANPPTFTTTQGHQETAGEKIANYLRTHDSAKTRESVDEYDSDVRLTASYSISGEVFHISTYNSGSRYATQLSWTVGNSATAVNSVTIVVGGSSYEAHLKLSFLSSGTIGFNGETDETFPDGSPVTADRLNRAFNQMKFGVDGAYSAIFSPLNIRPW